MSADTSGTAIILRGQTSLLGEPNGVQLTTCGLTFTRALSIEEWTAFGKKLKAVEAAIQWFVGDWLRYGENTYGEKYTEALEATGFDYGYLANIKSVASKVESSRRRESLSWSHHQEVAALQPEQQEKLLDWAENEKASVKELRAKIKGKNEQPELHPLEELQAQISRLRPAHQDRNGRDNLFVRALDDARSTGVAGRVELAQIVINQIRALVTDLSDCADEIENKIQAAKNQGRLNGTEYFNAPRR